MVDRLALSRAASGVRRAALHQRGQVDQPATSPTGGSPWGLCNGLFKCQDTSARATRSLSHYPRVARQLMTARA
jgi:hypothetical protein